MTMRKVLHQVLTSDSIAVDDCLSFVRDGDTVLLADKGVALLACGSQLFAAEFRRGVAFRVVALLYDVNAQGLESQAVALGCELLDEMQWVEQTSLHDAVMSWK